MPMIDLDAKRATLEKVVKAAVIVGCLAVAAPVAMLAVQGAIAMVELAGIGVGLFVVANFAPVLATYVANKRIAALKAVVEANPIETMENLEAEKQEELDRSAGNITDFETEIRNFDDQMIDFKRQYPDEAAAYQELSGKMHDALIAMRSEQAAAATELQKFAANIVKARALWKMALAANKMIAKSQSAQAAVYAKIKEQVAFDTVRTQLNRAFANLSTAIERRKDTMGALPSGAPAVTIQAPVALPQRDTVTR